MNKILPLLLIPLLAAACHPKPDKKVTTADEVVNHTVLPEKRPTETAPTFLVTGKVVYHGNYCGGAAPSREMMEEARKAKPLAGKKFYIRRGTFNDVNNKLMDSVVTNENGNFSCTLPSGEYTLLLPEQKDKATLDNWRSKQANIEVTDETCLKDWFTKGFRSFTVDDAPADLPLIEIYRRCFLPDGIECLSYTGPMPP